MTKNKYKKDIFIKMYTPSVKSSRFYAEHRQDIYLNLGYDYRGHVFEKTLSKEIMKSKVVKSIMSMIEPMILYLIDSVKQIRTQYMFSVDKKERNLN